MSKNRAAEAEPQNRLRGSGNSAMAIGAATAHAGWFSQTYGAIDATAVTGAGVKISDLARLPALTLSAVKMSSWSLINPAPVNQHPIPTDDSLPLQAATTEVTATKNQAPSPDAE